MLYMQTCPDYRREGGKSKLITVSDGRADAESFWSDRKGQASAPDPFWLFGAVLYFGWA